MQHIERHALMGILIALLLAFLAASCMTEREYQLRRADIRAKAAHAPVSIAWRSNASQQYATTEGWRSASERPGQPTTP